MTTELGLFDTIARLMTWVMFLWACVNFVRHSRAGRKIEATQEAVLMVLFALFLMWQDMQEPPARPSCAPPAVETVRHV